MPKRLAAIAVLGVLVLIGYAVVTRGHPGTTHETRAQGCTVRVDGRIVFLTTQQAQNAAVIAAVGTRRRLPARAVSIALTTAYQESDLENLRYGDSDSLGLFQQRPSQGWGTSRQVLNPYYASNAFYTALTKVSGYQTMDIAHAAQAVQRSAYPAAYAVHERAGRDVASALTGYSPAALSCLVNRQRLQPQHPKAGGLTPRANAVEAALAAAYGDLPIRPAATSSQAAGQAHDGGRSRDAGRAIDVYLGPVDTLDRIRGWSMAQFLVANAARLHIMRVIFDARIWTAGPAAHDGWRPYTAPELTGHEHVATQAALEYRDRVNVDVW
jgi:hypothetical protein